MPITLPSADVSTPGKLARFALAVRKALADLDAGLGGGGTDYSGQIAATNAALAALTARVTAAETAATTLTGIVNGHTSDIADLDALPKIRVQTTTTPVGGEVLNDVLVKK